MNNMCTMKNPPVKSLSLTSWMKQESVLEKYNVLGCCGDCFSQRQTIIYRTGSDIETYVVIIARANIRLHKRVSNKKIVEMQDNYVYLNKKDFMRLLPPVAATY